MSPETDVGRVLAIIVSNGFVALLTAAAAERFVRRSGAPPAVDARLEGLHARLDSIERELRRIGPDR